MYFTLYTASNEKRSTPQKSRPKSTGFFGRTGTYVMITLVLCYVCVRFMYISN